jgi:LPS sulfotransferase NodH
MTRRNLLKRFVSHYICRYTNYWIGSKQEFHYRIASIQMPPIEPALVREQIKKDITAAAERTRFLQKNGIDFMSIAYEDLYLEKDSGAQTTEIANVMKFVGVAPIMSDDDREKIRRLLDRGANQWSSVEVYKIVPGIERVERELASEGLGSLFED